MAVVRAVQNLLFDDDRIVQKSGITVQQSVLLCAAQPTVKCFGLCRHTELLYWGAGLVNCTTIDWFTEWPADALYEVASKQLADEDLGSQEVKANICQVFVTAHQSVADVSKQMLQELKRHNYVTPTNYLETVRGYRYFCLDQASISFSMIHGQQMSRLDML